MHSISFGWSRIQTGGNVKTLMCSIWKYIHLHVNSDMPDAGYAGEHPAIGLYSMLCDLEQKTDGSYKH